VKIAIYGREFNENFNEAIYKIFEKLNKHKAIILVNKQFLEFIQKNLFYQPQISGTFSDINELETSVNMIFSIGGDGTFLESILYAKPHNIPIVGINTGRLGFLAYISKTEIGNAIDELFQNEFSIESRTVLSLHMDDNPFSPDNYALNEITVMKRDTSSMISIHVYINSEFLSTYWADGLIIATPTGSTAYSLSAGGPIIVPGSGNFVITPIAPHNLTIRPIVVSDNNVIKIIVESRSASFLAALDYRHMAMEAPRQLIVQKSDFAVKMVKLNNSSFYNTLRNRLLWGADKRN